MADHKLGAFFKKAEKALQEVAREYGFDLHLIHSSQGTWYFFPEVSADWQPEVAEDPKYSIGHGYIKDLLLTVDKGE